MDSNDTQNHIEIFLRKYYLDLILYISILYWVFSFYGGDFIYFCLKISWYKQTGLGYVRCKVGPISIGSKLGPGAASLSPKFQSPSLLLSKNVAKRQEAIGREAHRRRVWRGPTVEEVRQGRFRRGRHRRLWGQMPIYTLIQLNPNFVSSSWFIVLKLKVGFFFFFSSICSCQRVEGFRLKAGKGRFKSILESSIWKMGSNFQGKKVSFLNSPIE